MRVELELAKCRERTKDESVVLLMMEAKVDVLREFNVFLWNSGSANADNDLTDLRDALKRDIYDMEKWCLAQKILRRERAA